MMENAEKPHVDLDKRKLVHGICQYLPLEEKRVSYKVFLGRILVILGITLGKEAPAGVTRYRKELWHAHGTGET